jgi:hypothetical protein
MLDRRENSRAVRRDFEINLLRFELDQRIAGVHAVAGLLQPLRHARFDHGFAEFRNDNVGRHISSQAVCV